MKNKIKINKRRWDIVNVFEAKDRAALFRRMGPRDTFNIFCELYRFGYGFVDKDYFNKIDPDKIKNLSKIHSLFGRVKA